MRNAMRLRLAQRVTAVHETVLEHRNRLNQLRLAVETAQTGAAGWASHVVKLVTLVEARVTVDDAWVALRECMASLRAARSLAGSHGRRLVDSAVDQGTRGHLVDAIIQGQEVQGRLKRADDRLRAMAFLFAGDTTRPALLGVDAGVACQHLVRAVQACDEMLLALWSAGEGLVPI